MVLTGCRIVDEKELNKQGRSSGCYVVELN